MSAPWRIVRTDEERVERLARELSVSDTLARILVLRGFTTEEEAARFLRKSMVDLKGPFELAGMDRAAERVAHALANSEKILVHGDFDADGITATALLTLFLRSLGGAVTPFVPNRLVEGHGISPKAIEAAQREHAALVITCDCGISSHQEVAALRALGIDTIVTDHHAVPAQTPADAILVNPKLEENGTEQAELSGVGVAFMLVVAVRSRLRDTGFFADRQEPNLKDYLDIVALGTLADLAPVRGQNRILVAHGLERIAASRRPGLAAMRETAGLAQNASIQADDVGFRLAPRINAAARLGHADEALELLLTADPSRAAELARSVETWNSERKALQERMVRVARIEAERQVREGRRAVVVASPDFHVGVIGLVAQKLAEIYARPAFVFAVGGETSRGSGRSAGAIDLIAAMEDCRDLFLAFGGHREAGGGTVESRRLGEFETRFERAATRQGPNAVQEVLIDAELKLRQLSEEILCSLEQLRPFGVGNRTPLFLARARVVGGAREVGKGHLRVGLSDPEGSHTFSAVGFGMWKPAHGDLKGLCEIAYSPEFNVWEGRKGIQLRLKGIRSV
ncbi:MAG: single-stranded-DNA-specific exonuclease RecJ [Pseudomonadota bacterium]